MQALPAGGAMLAVAGRPRTRSLPLLRRAASAIAAVNGPTRWWSPATRTRSPRWRRRWRGAGRRPRGCGVSHAFHSPLMEPMLAEFRAVARGGRPFSPPTIPVVSTLTGDAGRRRWTDPGLLGAPGPRSRCGSPTRVARARGPGRHHLPRARPGRACSPRWSPALPRRRGEPSRSQRRARGTSPSRATRSGPGRRPVSAASPVDWAALFSPGRRAPVDLPTYAFQRQRYWLRRRRAGATSPRPGCATPSTRCSAPPSRCADADGLLLTGRLSLRTHPWLADHAVARHGPAARHRASSSWPCAAGDQVGLPPAGGADPPGAAGRCPTHGGVQVQVAVGAAGRGRPPAGRPSTPGPRRRRRRGPATPPALLAAGRRPAAPADLTAAWPPAGADRSPSTASTTGSAEPASTTARSSRACAAAWRHGDEVYAEVALPAGALDADGFGLHPALLDAALHAVGCSTPAATGRGPPCRSPGRGSCTPPARPPCGSGSRPPGRTRWPSPCADEAGAARRPGRLAGAAADRPSQLAAAAHRRRRTVPGRAGLRPLPATAATGVGAGRRRRAGGRRADPSAGAEPTRTWPP